MFARRSESIYNENNTEYKPDNVNIEPFDKIYNINATINISFCIKTLSTFMFKTFIQSIYIFYVKYE